MKNKKEIIIVIACIFSLLFLTLLPRMFMELEKMGYSEYSIQSWITVLTTHLTIIGTWMVARLIWKDEKKSLQKMHIEKTELDREYAFRSMNRESIDFFYEQLEIFVNRLKYGNDLLLIEQKLNVSIFSLEYKFIDVLNCRFIESIKSNYWYDKDIMELCVKTETRIKNIDFSYNRQAEYIDIMMDFDHAFFIKKRSREFDDFTAISLDAWMKLFEVSYKEKKNYAFVLKLNAFLKQDDTWGEIGELYLNDYLVFIDYIHHCTEDILDKIDSKDDEHRYNFYIKEFMITILNEIFAVFDSEKSKKMPDIIQIDLVYNSDYVCLQNENKNIKIEFNVKKMLEKHPNIYVLKKFYYADELVNYGIYSQENVDKYRELISKLTNFYVDKYYYQIVESNKLF